MPNRKKIRPPIVLADNLVEIPVNDEYVFFFEIKRIRLTEEKIRLQAV